MQTHQLSSRAITVTDFLSATECQALIAFAEASGFEPAGVRTPQGQQQRPEIRNNARAMAPGGAWVSTLWQRLRAVRACEAVEDHVALGLPKDLRFYRYGPGQRFKMHKDGPWREDGRTSRLSFLVYLNEGFEGGDTDFRDFRVVPQTGMALLFVHEVWHEGAAVTAGTKYVLRSDVMYPTLSEPVLQRSPSR